MPVQPDVNTADWSAAQRRLTGSPGGTVLIGEPVSIGEAGAADDFTDMGEAGPEFAAPAATAEAAQPPPAPPSAVTAGSSRRRRWIYFTRLWAFVKMASLAYTTWWAMGYVHASPGATASAGGAVCLFAGFGARWRKRFFGPGQIVEPDLYEEIGRWMYRLGVVLVLIGGAVVIAQWVLSGGGGG
jgi:hypothetical protein